VTNVCFRPRANIATWGNVRPGVEHASDLSFGMDDGNQFSSNTRPASHRVRVPGYRVCDYGNVCSITGATGLEMC